MHEAVHFATNIYSEIGSYVSVSIVSIYLPCVQSLYADIVDEVCVCPFKVEFFTCKSPAQGRCGIFNPRHP